MVSDKQIEEYVEFLLKKSTTDKTNSKLFIKIAMALLELKNKQIIYSPNSPSLS